MLDRAAILEGTVREGFSAEVIPEQRPKQIMAMGCVFTTSHLEMVIPCKAWEWTGARHFQTSSQKFKMEGDRNKSKGEQHRPCLIRAGVTERHLKLILNAMVRH